MTPIRANGTVQQLTRPPGSYRRQLGRELRAAREAAGFTQEGAAGFLQCKQGKIAKIEVDLVEIDAGDLEKLMHMYRLTDATRARLWEAHANSDIPRSTANLPKRSKAYQTLADLEGEASEILSWHSERMPGLLQSEAYMLKQFTLHRQGDIRTVELLLRDRTARNSLFTGESPPHYRVVLSVTSLLRLPGGANPGLRLDQLDHLVALLEKYERLDLRLLTFDAEIAAAVSDFTVLRFQQDIPDYVNAKEFAYTENSGGGQVDHDIRPFLRDWEELSAAAISRADTLEYLKQWAARVTDELRGHQKGTTS